MKNRSYLLAIALTTACLISGRPTAHAQTSPATDDEAAKAFVENFFRAFDARDLTVLERAFVPNAACADFLLKK